MPKALILTVLSGAGTIVSAWVLGALLLRGLKLKLCRQEERLFAFLCGSALLSLFVFGLSALHLVYRGVFAGIAALLLAVALWLRLHRSEAPLLPPFKGAWRWLFWAAYAAYAFLYLVHALKPEMSPDGASYHLGHVARFARAHGLAPSPDDMYGMLSQGAEMLFLFAFLYGRHSAAALVHCAFTLALPLVVLAYARRKGMPRAGAAGAILAFAAPVMGVSGAAAYNDVAAAAVIFGCFYLLEIWDQTREWRLLIPVGLLAGFAYAIKYTAFLCVPFALGWLAWRLWRRPGELAKAAAPVALAALVMITPWLARNAIYYENPLAPFFNAWFPNPYQDPGFEQVYRRVMRTYHQINSPGQIPRQALYRGDIVQGLVGPVFVLAPLALLALRFPTGRRLLLAGAIFALPYTQNIGTRFLIPALPFVSLAMAMVLDRVPALMGAVVVLHAALSWPAVVAKYAKPYAFRLDGVPWKAALRLESEEAVLGREPGYRRARAIDRHVPEGETVFAFTAIFDGYTSRNMLTGYQSVRSRTVWEMFSAAALEGSRPSAMVEWRIAARPWKRIRLVETVSHPQEVLGIAEVIVWKGDRALPRGAGWRVTAWPNHWQAPMAVDHSAVTRWNSQLPRQAGFFYEVDFGEPLVFERVSALLQPPSHSSRLKLEGDGGNGRWETIAGPAAAQEWAPPLGLRRMVNEELRRSGIGYVLAQAGDAVYEDLDAKRDLWGLELVWEEEGAKLYRVTAVQK